jgi:gas vesicle protein GvpL/GvpF
MSVSSRVWYLYGVVPCGQPLPSSAGVPLEVIPYCRLAAIVEPVSAAEFSPESLAQKLQCVDWVAPLARRHTTVLEQVLQHGPVVPARLCTLFSTTDALTTLLAQHAQQLQDRLRWLEGRQEWGLKIFCHEDRLRSAITTNDPDVQALESAALTASPGQAYVLRKQRDGYVADIATTRIEEVVDEVLESLAGVAVELRLRSLRSVAATGRRETMVVNAALLVDTAACAALHTAAGELTALLGPEGFDLELTGPWPSFSFCGDDNGTSDLGIGEPASREGYRVDA